MRVTVWVCTRCNLQFVADDPPDKCPKCLRLYSGHVTIRLAGRDVEVDSARLYGENPLKKVAAGLDSLRLGARCPHGWLISSICPNCP
jgi:hypothetical protein